MTDLVLRSADSRNSLERLLAPFATTTRSDCSPRCPATPTGTGATAREIS